MVTFLKSAGKITDAASESDEDTTTAAIVTALSLRAVVEIKDIAPKELSPEISSELSLKAILCLLLEVLKIVKVSMSFERDVLFDERDGDTIPDMAQLLLTADINDDTFEICESCLSESVIVARADVPLSDSVFRNLLENKVSATVVDNLNVYVAIF